MLALLLAFACAPKPAAPATPGTVTAAAATAATTTLPTPYTVEQFLAAFPEGTTVRLRFVEPGKTHDELWTFRDVDATGALLHKVELDAAGTPGAVLESQRYGWAELRDHAAFPAAHTQVTQATVTVPAGSFAVTRYAVDETSEEGGPMLVTYDFDPAHAGPPVHMVVVANGTTVLEMSLVERK